LKAVILFFEFCILRLQKQFEYVHPEVSVDTQVKNYLNPSSAEGCDSGSRIETKREQIKKTSTVLLQSSPLLRFLGNFDTQPQHASAVVHHKVAVHHKAHTVCSKSSSSIGVHHKVIAVIPERTTVEKQDQTAPASTKSSSTVIGGMIVYGY
jgi:hypothetical protein